MNEPPTSRCQLHRAKVPAPHWVYGGELGRRASLPSQTEATPPIQCPQFIHSLPGNSIFSLLKTKPRLALGNVVWTGLPYPGLKGEPDVLTPI